MFELKMPETNSDVTLYQNFTNFNYTTTAAITLIDEVLIWSTSDFLNAVDTTVPLDPVNSTDVPYTPYNLRPETYIIPILFAIIFLVGVIGNGTLVIVFLRHRAMRNVPNT